MPFSPTAIQLDLLHSGGTMHKPYFKPHHLRLAYRSSRNGEQSELD